jgi:hypothetical protein
MKYYTYAHFTADTKKVFYIGKGCKRRAWQTASRNSYWKHKVAKHGHIVEILAEWNTEAEAFEHEKFLIGCFESQLVNLTDGGEGTSGRQQGEEEKQKRSIKLKGIPLTEQRKANISHALQGRKLQTEHAAKSKSILAVLREETKKKVKCLTSGFVYDSVTEAGIKESVDPSSIVKACKGILKRAGKKEWRYV